MAILMPTGMAETQGDIEGWSASAKSLCTILHAQCRLLQPHPERMLGGKTSRREAHSVQSACICFKSSRLWLSTSRTRFFSARASAESHLRESFLLRYIEASAC
jgi:hypothetical protein